MAPIVICGCRWSSGSASSARSTPVALDRLGEAWTPLTASGGRARLRDGRVAEPIEAWAAAEGGRPTRWWRVKISDLPGGGNERRKAQTRIRNSWSREIERQRTAGVLPADASYSQRFTTEGGKEYFTWGPSGS